jgi:hypothetical protein
MHDTHMNFARWWWIEYLCIPKLRACHTAYRCSIRYRPQYGFLHFLMVNQHYQIYFSYLNRLHFNMQIDGFHKQHYI